MNGSNISPTANHVHFPNFFANPRLTDIHTSNDNIPPTSCATTGIGISIISGANTHRPGFPALVVNTKKLCPEINASYHLFPIFLKTKHQEMTIRIINATIPTQNPAIPANNAAIPGSIPIFA